jgi:hypothetical protein
MGPHPSVACQSCEGDGFGGGFSGTCGACGGSGVARSAERFTGTRLEPVPVPKTAGNRYCIPCDKFMRARVCKACGLETERMPA